MSNWTDLQIDDMQTLKESRYPGFPDEEMEMFRRVCNRTQLDPFAGQIMLDRRWTKGQGGSEGRNVYSPYTQIDGFRVIAERTQDYAGQEGPHWYDVGGEGYESEEARWFSPWPFWGTGDKRRYPYAARVSILRKGFDKPLVSVVRWDAYAQKTRAGGLNRIWQERGDFQLAKCAEALGLRRACPNLLSGLVSAEELDVIKSGEEADAQGAAVGDLDAFDRVPDGSEETRDGWLELVKNAEAPGLAAMSEELKEQGKDSMSTVHEAEVLAAISTRLNALAAEDGPWAEVKP